MTKRIVPPLASVVHNHGSAKLSAPSAERNASVLCELIHMHAPQRGNALEIASGTGQHIVQFAAAVPQLHWQPSEIDPDRSASIDIYVKEAGLSNLAPSVALDATNEGWGKSNSGKSLIVLVNLLHLISYKEAQTLLSEVKIALVPGGILILYGPFKRDGALTSDGDKRFHDALVKQDPEIGYKDISEIRKMAVSAELEIQGTIEMPANNLALILVRPS